MSNVFFIAFTIALTVANFYCFFRKKYLYLFIPCMLFLPNYYALEISGSFPLITATRIMFCYFYIYALINKRRKLSLKTLELKKMPKECWLLCGYFFLRIVSNLYYVTTYSQAIKTIFAIIFEQLLLIIAVYLLAPSKKEINTLIKIIVWTATVMFIVGIIESIFSVRPFDALYTSSRMMINMQYIRLGLLRATTTLVAPAVYGNMCIWMLPLIFYLYETTRSKIYLVVAGLDVLAIIHSGSRSDMFFLIAVLALYVVIVLKNRENIIRFSKNAVVVAGFLLLFMCSTSFVNENLRYFYTGNLKSVLNEIGFDFDLNEGAPPGTKGFGTNPDGTTSRLRQLTGIYYTATVNPLFGLGSAAQRRGDVKYAWKGVHGIKFCPGYAYDLGLVEIFCDEGLIGLLGICSLILFMIIRAKGKKYAKLAIACYLLTTLSTGNMYYFLFVYMIIFSLNNYFEKENEKCINNPEI